MNAAIWQWKDPLPICVYGPAFIWIAKVAVGVAAPFGAAAQLLSIRALCALALIACAPLLAALFDAPRRPELAIAGVLLTPVALWFAAEGQNDTLLLEVVLLGLLVLKRLRQIAEAVRDCGRGCGRCCRRGCRPRRRRRPCTATSRRRFPIRFARV